MDASIVVKWYIPEVGTLPALEVLEGEAEFHAPDLLLPEIGSVLWKKSRRAEIQQEEALRIMRGLSVGSIMLQPVAELATQPLEITLSTGLSIYDSAYLALAFRLNCAVITADRKLVQMLAGGPLARMVHAPKPGLDVSWFCWWGSD